MSDKKVLIITSNFGIEKDELIKPLEMLKNHHISVTHAAIEIANVQTVEGDKDFSTIVQPDITLKEVDSNKYDLLIVPGGTVNAGTLRVNQDAQNIINMFVTKNKILAFICHAPWLLINSNQVKGKTLTSFNSIRLDLENAGANWVNEKVHECSAQNWVLITSRCPDDIPAFNQAILSKLQS